MEKLQVAQPRAFFRTVSGVAGSTRHQLDLHKGEKLAIVGHQVRVSQLPQRRYWAFPLATPL